MKLIRRLRNALAPSGLRRALVWFRHRGLKASDVFLASYPRSGNTWLRCILCDLLTGRSEPMTWVFENTADPGRQNRTPALLPEGGRLIKTHESYHPDYKRAVLLVRDVRDVVVSEHAYSQGTGTFEGSLEMFIHRFLAGRVNGFGRWDVHTESWLAEASERPRDILVLRFEDLRLNTVRVVSKTAAFLGIASSSAEISRAVENNTLEKMRQKEDEVRDTYFSDMRADHRFVRRGSIGGWKGLLTTGQVSAIENVCGKTLETLGYPVGY